MLPSTIRYFIPVGFLREAAFLAEHKYMLSCKFVKMIIINIA